MRRRKFITLLGGTVAAWPLAARAQEREKVRRIGVMASLAADDRDAQLRNRSVPARPAAGRLERRAATSASNIVGLGQVRTARRHAAELVALAADVILAGGSQAATPLLQSTRTIPVVFVTPPTRSAPAWSAAWPSRAATPPVLLSSNMASLENGWSFSSRLRRPRRARRCTRCGHYRRDRPVGGDPVGRAGLWACR